MKTSLIAGIALALSASFAMANEPTILNFDSAEDAKSAECGGYTQGLSAKASDNITKVKVLGETADKNETYELETPINACQLGKLAADLDKEVVGFGTKDGGNVITIDGYNPSPN